MTVTLRLRKADLEVLATVDSLLEGDQFRGFPYSGKQMKAWTSLYERVLKAELKPRKSKTATISVSDALNCFRGVLGKRLVVPAGNAGPAWWSQLQNRINASGLTAPLCTEAARIAGDQWKGPIKGESIIRQADALLSDYQHEFDLPEAAEDMTEL